MDKHTVDNIKHAKKKMVQENFNLKKQMGEMAGILNKTTGENQKLRTHIRVLIEDR